VSVPVLSNKQKDTLPAKGTLNGSVQNMPAFINDIRAVFTANAICKSEKNKKSFKKRIIKNLKIQLKKTQKKIHQVARNEKSGIWLH
jgi:hypothetical protein